MVVRLMFRFRDFRYKWVVALDSDWTPSQVYFSCKNLIGDLDGGYFIMQAPIIIKNGE